MLRIKIPRILPGRVFIALASFVLFLAAVPEFLFCAEFEPGKRLSGFAEAGIESRRLRISIFYEGLRFSKSNLVHLYDNLYAYQPKSKADIFGITAGLKF